MSNNSSSSDRSPISTAGSTFSNSDPRPKLIRQCSIQHVVHKNFLEPICDDCLLEELGLQPELGPILGGRDLQEGLHGEEWILESSVEINVEDPDDDRTLSAGCEDDDDDATDADDEGESRGRSGRRQGMDISRNALRISSDLSVDEHESLGYFREQLRDTEPEARRITMTIIKAPEMDKPLRRRWSQQFRKGLTRRRKDDRRPISTSPADDRSTNSSPQNSVPSAWKDPKLRVRPTSLVIDAQLSSPILPETVRNASLDPQDEIISLYETNHGEDFEKNPSYPSWSQHLQADLQDRQARKAIELTAAVPEKAIFEGPLRSPSSTRSSPQIATPCNSASWSPPNLQPLNISSSEFDKDDTTTAPQLHSHAHATSVDSTLSTSTFCTANSSPSSPSSTRPTTTTSTMAQPQTQTQTPFSLHPLSTAISISTPHRPALTPRTSSLRSPPASSPLLHSTPPLHQSPTSVFACVHERWAFRECGCKGPSWVRSCVCEPARGPDAEDGREKGEEVEAEDTAMAMDVNLDVEWKDGCRAAQPVVRTRWFFNQSCEACLGSHDDNDAAAVAAGGLTQ